MVRIVACLRIDIPLSSSPSLDLLQQRVWSFLLLIWNAGILIKEYCPDGGYRGHQYCDRTFDVLPE